MHQLKSAFISYSWDSDIHQEWVINLVNNLRREGVAAKLDVFETQTSTVNLNAMMIKNMRENDYIIIVLTEKYAEKADNLQGGVGYETMLSLQSLKSNPNKFIFLLKHSGNFEKAFPFHLNGYYAIDFSNDENYSVKFEELLHRIQEIPLYEMAPIGKPRTLKPKNQKSNEDISKNGIYDFSDLNLKTLKRFTDRDIDVFLKSSYKQIIDVFDSLFTQIQTTNNDFEFDKDEISNYKAIFNLYMQGQYVIGIKIWYGGAFGRNTINFFYGRHIDSNDNSMSEILTNEIDENNQLKLKMTIMHLSRKNDPLTPQDIVKEIWRNNISHYIK
ncbi:toll/interleukin-1 receptor domain-containing protein [Sutcliffiella horikoshii]|uniref:toll/interleukin-1 receptor domain-containing protein n=1 Tax=Sutcliffiella horikoshii TaxID=79883 RepID=UPI003CF9AA10